MAAGEGAAIEDDGGEDEGQKGRDEDDVLDAREVASAARAMKASSARRDALS